MRVTIVQYGGDYREAWERFDHGGKATYQAQRYSVDFVSSLAQRLEQVAVICASTAAAYDVELPNKVRAIGAGFSAGFRPRDLVPLVDRTSPNRLILVTPMAPILKWAAKNRVRTLMTLADSFKKGGFLTSIRHRRLAHLSNGPNVEWVGNHGIAACLSVASIGVRPDKIIPWDWPPSHRPSDYGARNLDKSKRLTLVYVGSISEAKGVGDLLRAVHHLKGEGLKPVLTIVGRDHDGTMQDLAGRLGLIDRVSFAGVIANEDIPETMRSADAVIIPSRHEYPEGLPLTIYEALAARTPIIASDHPMFHGALSHEQTALVFRAGDFEALADAIRRLSTDAELYARMSSNSERAWQALQLPVTWGDLIERWLADDEAGRHWLGEHRLNSGRYREQIAARASASDFDA
jgi:glycosyltransferase involved in cell wall biosynthesis